MGEDKNMVYEIFRMMAGPYLCSLIDAYLANQDVLNCILIAGGVVWSIYDKKYRKNKKETPKVKVMGMTLYGNKD